MPKRGELRRTPDWIESDVPGAKVKRAVEPGEYIKPSDSGSKSDAPVTLPTRKEKPKTKGTTVELPTTDDQPHEKIEHETTSSHHSLRFTLSKKPYHTFSTLFHKPSTTSQPGEVPWTDFVSAMSAISFLPEKLYGSVWRFKPKDGDVFGTETPINLHEPHPVTKMPFRTARLYGRRLT